jgi:hypothetical protein
MGIPRPPVGGLGITWRCLLYKGKQRRFAQRIASAFPDIT